MDGEISYQVYTLVIPAAGAAGDIARVSLNNNSHLRILSATNGTINDLAISINDGPMSRTFVGMALAMQNYITGEGEIKRIALQNLNAAANTIRFAVAAGEIADNRLEISGATISATITGITMPTAANAANTSVPNATNTVVVAANTSRKSVTVGNPSNSAFSVWLGDSATAAVGEGIELLPGEKVTLSHTAAVYAYQTSGGAIVVSYLEVT